MFLRIINFLILVICLFIISEIIRLLGKKKKKPMGGLLFLHSKKFIQGLRIVFLGITIWIFKEFFLLLEKIETFSILGIYLEDFLGIAAAVILSYGLYLILFPIKKVFQKGKEEKEE